MEKKLTPSEPINKMMEMAIRVAEDGAEPEPLREALVLKLEETAKGREEFEGRLHFHDRGFAAEYEELIHSVVGGFEAYEAAMRHMLGFFETGSAESLLEANDMLVQVAGPLHEALQEYSRVYLSYGPSPYPEMNAVRNTLRAICEGSATPAALEEVVETSVTHYETCIQEIDEGDGLTEEEGWQAKRKAFEDLIRAMQELEPVMDERDIEEAVRPLQLALEAKTLADEKIFTNEMALNPTGMPAANVLINAARAAMKGQIELEDVEDALDWYKGFVEDIERQFEDALEGETNSLVITEELPKTREIIDLHDEVVERLEDSFDNFCEEEVEPILEDLIEIVERLEASADVYLEAANREGKLVCVKCGHANPPVNRSCESCGFNLPKLMDPTQYSATFEIEERSGLEADSEEDEYHMGVNTYRLFEACYNFFENNITAEEFQAEIDRSRATLAASDEGLMTLSSNELTDKQEDMMTPEELDAHKQNVEMFEETRELLIEGMEEWADGLDDLEDYISSRHRPTIEAGIQKIFVASQKIDKVKKLGEAAEKALGELEDKLQKEMAEDRAAAHAPRNQPAPPAEEEPPAPYDDGLV